MARGYRGGGWAWFSLLSCRRNAVGPALTKQIWGLRVGHVRFVQECSLPRLASSTWVLKQSVLPILHSSNAK